MYITRIIGASEKDRYNKFVAGHPKGDFLQLWEWGQVKAFTGWEPLPLILEEDGEIKASLLILKRRLPLPVVNKCIFYSPRGPVANVHDADLLTRLFEGARQVAKAHGAIFLKIDPDILKTDQVFYDNLVKQRFVKNDTGLDFEGVQPAFVYRLDIRPAEEALLAAMHSKTRYNIRLAEKKGVTIRQSTDKKELPVFYALLQETAERDNFLIRSESYFGAVWDQMVASGHAKVFFAETPEGEPIAATLAMILGEKAWYLYGASSNRHRSLMPNYLIQWEMICWAKAEGCTLYDFRGVSGDMNEDNPLYGLYRFKKGFSGELAEFIGDWDLVYSSFYYTLWQKALPAYRNLLRKRTKK